MSILEYKLIWYCCCRIICHHLYSDFDVREFAKILFAGAFVLKFSLAARGRPREILPGRKLPPFYVGPRFSRSDPKDGLILSLGFFSAPRY